jgi:dihydrofolate synthase/folylpolyglutamate synthase
VFPAPAACAITSISLDHQDFLGSDLARIAWEKGGIIKPGRPVATGHQSPDVRDTLRACAAEAGAPLLERGRDWEATLTENQLVYTDATGSLTLPKPSLAGAHQIDNAGIAIAALRASGIGLPRGAYPGIAAATWPARLQRLTGRLAAALPPNLALYLDGGHNQGAGQALGEHLATWSDQRTHLIVGMKQSKDIGAFLAPLLPYAETVWAVQEPGQHLALPVPEIVAASGGRARPGPTVAAALQQIAAAERGPARILICGSLYLAGEVLKADNLPRL